MLCGAAGAQQAAEEAAAQRRPFALSPYASITETLTDNVNLTSSKRSDLITQPTVGLHADADLAWLKGFLDYSLTGLWYARDSAGSRLQHALNAFATAEIVRNRAGVDLAGNISQQSRSPVGVQSPDTSLNNPNQTSVASLSVSPYLRGRLVGTVDYEARLRYMDTRSNDAPASDYTLSSQSLSVGDPNVGGALGWSTQLSRTVVDYDGGARTEADVLRGVLDWNLTPELVLSAIGGTEANNYVSADKERHSLWGAGVKWRPSPRTDLSAEAQRRFFGNSHSILFTHRTARTVWSFTDVRDASTNTTPLFGNLGTAYDLFFRQFASIEPNPILRQQLVNNFLLAHGISPTATATAQFLSSAVTLQRMQNLSFAW
ncbi:MAG TPA: TIGR03016 family PEP-CTERM system-associated outer membrane protein, partial [Burkholderiaceae bacterium]|nr:TIGR03016 family PEP-CTERM system-associated outer membrane protein [Burkholderiaceae bacterium]